MKILVTGAKGFIGKNLVEELKNRGYQDLYLCDIDTTEEELKKFCSDCEFVYNLAGINRPKNPEEFMKGNFGFASRLLDLLKKYKNTSPIVNASSIQAALDNPYGQSKKAGEKVLADYGEETGASIYNYRFHNAFGKWGRPNYNSVVATFCYNVSRDIPIQVNNRDTKLELLYIDDLLSEIISCFEDYAEGKGETNRSKVISDQGEVYYVVPCIHEVTLGEIEDLLISFKESRTKLVLPELESGSFIKKLYSTYLSYLPEDQFSYPLTMHEDERGSFTELIRTRANGQFSVNISKPGIVKGNHWHHTKNEKFIVISGKALFQFRKIGEDKIISYHASGEKIEVVDIPPGYTHTIINEGDTDLVTFIWANECFDPNKADTIYEEVKKDE